MTHVHCTIYSTACSPLVKSIYLTWTTFWIATLWTYNYLLPFHFFLFLSLGPIHFEIFIEPKWFSFVCRSLSFSWHFRPNDNLEIYIYTHTIHYTLYTFISINSPDAHFKYFFFFSSVRYFNCNEFEFFSFSSLNSCKAIESMDIFLPRILWISSLIRSTFHAVKWHDEHGERKKTHEREIYTYASDRGSLSICYYILQWQHFKLERMNRMRAVKSKHSAVLLHRFSLKIYDNHNRHKYEICDDAQSAHSLES